MTSSRGVIAKTGRILPDRDRSFLFEESITRLASIARRLRMEPRLRSQTCFRKNDGYLRKSKDQHRTSIFPFHPHIRDGRTMQGNVQRLLQATMGFDMAIRLSRAALLNALVSISPALTSLPKSTAETLRFLPPPPALSASRQM